MISLRWPDGRHQELDPVDGRIHVVHSGHDAFVGVLHTGTGTDDGHSRLFVLDTNGACASAHLCPR